MKWIVVTLFIIGATWCQQDLLNQLPELNMNDIETAAIENYAKDALTLLKDKCANVSGGDEVYTELQTRTKELQTFVMNSINVSVVMSELEEAKKTGSMDEVFAKYCAKEPEAMERLRNITETFKKCLVPDEQKSIEAKLNLTEKMVHFLCEKDGDKIAMFIANGGEECLSSKVEGIQACVNRSSDVMPTANWQSISLLDIDEKICEEFPTLEKCVVNVLEECKIKTPANIVGALFRYLRKNMECAPQKEYVTADSIDTNRLKRQITESVAMRIQKKCIKNGGNIGAYENLERSFNDFLMAFRDNILYRNEDCLILKRNTDFLLDTFVLNLKVCMTPKEDFLPLFIRNSVEGIFDYLCEDEGKKLQAFKKSSGLQCMAHRDMEPFARCTKPTYTHSVDAGEIILKQDEFCRDVDSMRKCTIQYLVDPCDDDKRFKEITQDLLGIINNKCSGCSIFVNTFLLFGLVLFQIKAYFL